MRLIGMLDSPYVRRVAVSLNFFGHPYAHDQVSVFRNYDLFSAINPVVKAPTFITEDGLTLMDSTLILEYLEARAPSERSLVPMIEGFGGSQRIIGLALAACEKSVQIVYERTLRPEEKQHEPWLERVRGQLLAAYRLLEGEIAMRPLWMFADRPMQADITTAIVWSFTQSVLPEIVAAEDYPAIAALSAKAEALPEFLASPGD
jgi:glutathione S-transferase